MTTRKNIFEGVEEQIFFNRFFLFLKFMQDEIGTGLTNEVLSTKWMNLQSQSAFLYYLFQNHEQVDQLGYHRLGDKKNINQNVPINYFQKFKELPLLWHNLDLVRNFIVLCSENEAYELKAKNLILDLSSKYFEPVFYLLISIDIVMGNELMNQILEKMLDTFLKSSSTQNDIIEAFYTINRDYLIYLLVRVCKEGNFIFLSKILDFSQQIKDFFIPLTQTEYHYFSISLSLLAVKREFLRLENWIEGRLQNGSLAWIESFMQYFYNNLIYPFLDYSNHQKTYIEEVIERSQLSMNTIAVVFENFFLNERYMGKVDSDMREKIKVIYQSILCYIPDLTQICTNDTEKKANRILENLYFQTTTIEEFIKTILDLKNSPSNSDQEILSCIIINIIDEFRFYHQFPEKELYITSDIFGQFIEKKVIDGKVQIVFLKALNDSLEKDEKMFNFGLRAIQQFIFNINLDI